MNAAQYLDCVASHPHLKEIPVSDPNDWNKAVIEEFRANGGVVGGNFEGFPLLLLHTNGAKSNLERINPLVYFERDGRIFVFASKAGADSDPDWYRNLVAHPDVKVELGTESFDAIATSLVGDDREEIYAAQEIARPNFAEYRLKTTRVIPVVELARA
jgi:deazaflavin-dependent oxidoreductase (nitroreductase family)